ncbi:MAG: hypothetical protein IJ027_04520 [Oscillospiraceae bacterium]|nr:hypothetical protein [Oscillospiraceae bacterium]
MKCNSCSFESEQDFAFCPNCSAPAGEPVSVDAPIPNPIGEKVMAALKDKLFLVLCILLTAASALSVIGDSIQVLNILFTIFLWIAYSKAQKNIVDTKQLRNVSGVAYAQYIIFNVVSVILLVCGVILGVVLGFLGGGGLSNELLSQFGEFDVSIAGILVTASGWLFFIIFTVIAVALFLINLFCFRKLHGLAKSVYQSIESYTPTVNYAVAAKNWLIVLGVLSAVSAATSISGENFLPAVADACGAAATILAGLLVNKYLVSEQ